MKAEKLRFNFIYRPIGFLHAMPDGGPVYRGESSWRTVNGVYLNTVRTGFVCLTFRRNACPIPR